MGILSWVVLGLIAGLLAKWIMPGAAKSGLLLTCLLGVGGAFVGGFIGSQLGWGQVGEISVRTIALSVGGALIVLYVFGFLMARKR